jgi:hypothetical protein
MEMLNDPTTTNEHEVGNDAPDHIRSRRRRPNLGTSVCVLVALAAAGAAVGLSFGARDGSAEPAAGLQPTLNVPEQDPLVTRYGQQPEWLRCMKLHEPLIMRYGRCADPTSPATPGN